MPAQIPLSALAERGIQLRPAEAVAIVGEICRQRAARILPGLPSAGVIRLTSNGEITIEGPVPAGHDAVARAAQLLESLLPGFDAPAEFRVSGALRLVIARALGILDLPPYASLEDFCAALVRFTTLDARETVMGLLAAWRDAGTRPEHAPTPVAEPQVAPSAGARRARLGVWLVPPAAAAALLALALRVPASRVPQPHAEGAAQQARDAGPVARPSERPTVANSHAEVRARSSPRVVDVTTPRADAVATRESPRLLRAYAFSPTFATTGNAVYFHEQRSGTSALKRADTTGRGSMSDVRDILRDQALNFHPRPSPDGSRIAFDSDRDGVRAVFVANADGSSPQRISGDGFASVPSWSPDGRHLAFVKGEPRAPRVWNLWIADADGSHLRRLTKHRVGQAWGGSWFPDGRRIAYSVENQLVILDLATGTRRVFRSPRPGRLLRTPAVSPDGHRIVFQVYHDGTWVADVATGAMRRVLADPTAEEYTWAPDGHHIAFHSHRGGTWGVWVMPL